MGGDDTAVIDRVNTEMTDLGNKPYRYSFNETLNTFLPDYYIIFFLVNSLDATSWDSVIDNVEKVCYKGYPGCQLPNLDKISI